MFIVRVGGFESNSNAREGQKKLENLGYKGTLIRKRILIIIEISMCPHPKG